MSPASGKAILSAAGGFGIQAEVLLAFTGTGIAAAQLLHMLVTVQCHVQTRCEDLEVSYNTYHR